MSKATTDLMELLDAEASKTWCVKRVEIYFWYGTADAGQCRVQAVGSDNRLLGFEDLNLIVGQYGESAKKLQAMISFIGAVRNSTEVVDLVPEIDPGSTPYLWRLGAWNAAGKEIFFWDFRDTPVAPSKKPDCPKLSSPPNP